MLKKKMYASIGMGVGGIVLMFVTKGDPWPVGMYFFLYVCSGIGSVIGIYLSGKFLKSFIISVFVTTFLFFLGGTILDICNEGFSVIADK